MVYVFLFIQHIFSKRLLLGTVLQKVAVLWCSRERSLRNDFVQPFNFLDEEIKPMNNQVSVKRGGKERS